jgi:HK97 family phage major capsid protein
VDKIKALLEELAGVVAEMEAMTEDAPEGEAPAEPMTEEQEASLRSLEAKADKLTERIEFLQRVQAKELELRSVLERAAPAKKIEATEEETAVESRKAPVYAIPKSHRPLRGFRSEERAYRAGMAIRAGLFNDDEARRWCMDHGVESRAQAGGINSLGGVLTNPELSESIVRLVEEFGAYQANARVVTMNSDTLLIARRTGGLSARAIGENAAPLSSDVTFDNVQLVAKLWGVDNRVPVSLVEDSVIDLADAMAVEVAQAFAETYDRVGFIGTGAGTDHGIHGIVTAINDGTHSASVVTAATGNTTFGADSTTGLDLSDFTNMVARLPLYARNRNAKFYISPAGYGASMLRLMMAASGNNQADVAGGANLQFLGFPVVLVHPMESRLSGTASQIACLFGDLSQAVTMGIRREVSVKTDASRFIEFDQLLTFATARMASVAHDLGSTTVAGPIVALKFAA